ncbi:MAG TPA: GNAT family N-acetyltransferase [Frateuria sp.]|uniref:GNAT family N-acetyltransferase n=1 Tax=Frateuria sp. TaxID=2211372 RepID=UPI002DEE6A02|nr:GNAT family N-acetyltransferase [Frateuria sp.]
MIISSGRLDDPRVVGLLRLHLAAMHAHSPPGTVHALDLSALKQPDVSFFTAWEDEELLGCGALRRLSDAHGEIKSMRTSPRHVRKGVAASLLRHMIGVARQRGYRRVSLETGSGEPFESAIALYAGFGFVKGDPFGEYVAGDFNQFFHLDLPSTDPVRAAP